VLSLATWPHGKKKLKPSGKAHWKGEDGWEQIFPCVEFVKEKFGG
jgi:hypothetical protein